MGQVWLVMREEHEGLPNRTENDTGGGVIVVARTSPFSAMHSLIDCNSCRWKA